MSTQARRRRAAPVAVAAAVALLLAAAAYLFAHSSKTVKPQAAPVAGKNAFSVPPGSVSGSGGTGHAKRIKFRPNHVYIPSLDVAAPVEPVHVSGGGLVIPENVRRVGIDSGAGSLSGSTGTVLLAGHVNFIGQGNGALYRLTDIKPGADIYVTGKSAVPTHWRAYSLRSVVKRSLPQDIFSASGPRRAVLVTCGGQVISVPGYGNTYEKNELVYAVQVPGVEQ